MTLRTTVEQLAKTIAADLFTNGNNERCVRLVMIDDQGRDRGGWIERAVAQRIEQALRQAMEER